MDKIKSCGTRVTDLKAVQTLLYQYTMKSPMDISINERLELLEKLFKEQIDFIMPHQLDIAKRKYDEDDL